MSQCRQKIPSETGQKLIRIDRIEKNDTKRESSVTTEEIILSAWKRANQLLFKKFQEKKNENAAPAPYSI